MATINLVNTVCESMMLDFKGYFDATEGVNGYLDFMTDNGAGAPGTQVVKIDFEDVAFTNTGDGVITINLGTASALEGDVVADGTIAFCVFKTFENTPIAMATVGTSGTAITMPNNVMAAGEKLQVSSLTITLSPTYTPA